MKIKINGFKTVCIVENYENSSMFPGYDTKLHLVYGPD